MLAGRHVLRHTCLEKKVDSHYESIPKPRQLCCRSVNVSIRDKRLKDKPREAEDKYFFKYLYFYLPVTIKYTVYLLI